MRGATNIWIPAVLVCLALLAPAAASARSGDKLVFTAVLNGGQVIPPSSSNALGVGFLTYDPATKRLCYSISYQGLVGTETEAHLHGGKVGETDAVFFDLTPIGSPKLGCIGPFAAKEARLLKRGETYIQIHTTIWVAGEVRGQVLPMTR